MPFEFKDIDPLTDGVIDLVVEKREAADPINHVPCYHYLIVRHGSRTEVGRIRLRVGSADRTPSLLTSGHMGCDIEEPHRGHGYAARASLLLKPVALAHGMPNLILTCDPENLPSRRTCERIGARLLGAFDIPMDQPLYQEGKRKILRFEWDLTRDL